MTEIELTQRERKEVKSVLRSIPVRKYGDRRDKEVGQCLRMTSKAKKRYHLSFGSFSGPELGWMYHTNIRVDLLDDGKEMDHQCGDPEVLGQEKKQKCSKCISGPHLRRKTHQENSSKRPCHKIIRLYFKYIHSKKRKRGRKKKGPIFAVDITVKELVTLWEKTQKKPATQRGINKAKKTFIQKHTCKHGPDEHCFIIYH